MAQRTIASGGGNWNSTATWVEGAVPTSSDHVVGDASSGQLTINVSATAQYVDFTNYTNTLTINSGLTLGLAAATSTFGASMSFAGPTSAQLACNVNHTFVQNTTNRIPHLRFGAGTKTSSTNLYVNVFSVGSTTTVSNGNIIYINTSFQTSNASNRISGTTILVLDGPVDFQNVQWGSATLRVDCGSVSVVPTAQISPLGRFEVLSGTVSWASVSNDYLQPQSNNTTFKLTTSQLFNLFPGSNANNPTINFEDTPEISVINLRTSADTKITTNQNIKIKRLWLDGFNDSGDNTTVFDTTYTYEIEEFVCASQRDFRSSESAKFLFITSDLPGTQSKFNFSGDVSMNYYVNFVDIDASFGNTIYTLGGTLSNTNNIQVVASMPGSAETSHTFVN